MRARSTGASVTVSVMEIGYVRVLVFDGFVTVAMRVPSADRRVVRMRVMPVVMAVFVFVFQGFMLVPVRVSGVE